jgi:hypothetical protein
MATKTKIPMGSTELPRAALKSSTSAALRVKSMTAPSRQKADRYGAQPHPENHKNALFSSYLSKPIALLVLRYEPL